MPKQTIESICDRLNYHSPKRSRYFFSSASACSAIAIGGLSLMVAQLWWFLGSKPKSQQAEMNKGVQEMAITVNGGYVPSLVTVKRGQPVREPKMV